MRARTHLLTNLRRYPIVRRSSFNHPIPSHTLPNSASTLSLSIVVTARHGRVGLREREALPLPDLELAVLGGLPCLLLVRLDRERALAVRRRAQRVPDVRPEVERRGVRHDLFPAQCVVRGANTPRQDDMARGAAAIGRR